VSQLADPGRTPFEDAKISTNQLPTSTVGSETSELQGTPDIRPKLAASRAYTLSLSPYFLYTRSELISVLISSKVYRQLEFMAVGSWWIHSSEHPNAESHELGATRQFHRVPGNREDVFADSNISMKSKRTLMRFLRHISKAQDEEEQDETEKKEDLSMPFADYLSSNFSVPQDLQNPLLSLSLSQLPQQDTSASYAVPRIKRHLASIGALGPGFGSVVPKYGGGSEILQVGCRASAVGGAVYALETGIQSIKDGEVSSESEHPVEVQLSNGETIQTRFLICSAWDLPSLEQPSCTKVARSITIASSTFTSLFPVTAEGGPVPASAVLMFPGDTLDSPQSPPVYLQVHSSDTGDCPRHQSVIYGSVAVSGLEGHTLLERAVDRLLQAEGPQAIALWSMRYNQLGRLSNGGTPPTIQTLSPHVFSFPPPSLDLAFEDETVDMIKQAWVKIVGDEVAHDEFMIFEDREGTSDD
jgi:RAB protein geranylgeranyltransferase component A